MNKKISLTIIGFLMFLLGIISIVLSIVGLKLTLLSWLYSFGPGMALLTQLVCIFGGIIVVFLANNDDSDLV